MADRLEVIYFQSGDGAKVDIVVVHGLAPTGAEDHARDTWTKGTTMWVKDLLPQQLKKESIPSRVLLYSYNASPALWSSTAGVLDQGKNLLNWLDLKGIGQRPVIFIAHSLGGIVVKRALLCAGRDDKYKPIRACTFGFAFFATPHRGATKKLTTVGSMVAAVARALLCRPKNDYLAALTQNNCFAEVLEEDSRQMLDTRPFLSFYETLPMPKIGIVVPKSSAVLGLSKEVAIPIQADHAGICKFDGTNDSYEQVEGNVVSLIKLAVKAWAVMSQRKAMLAMQSLSLKEATSSVKPVRATITDRVQEVDDATTEEEASEDEDDDAEEEDEDEDDDGPGQNQKVQQHDRSYRRGQNTVPTYRQDQITTAPMYRQGPIANNGHPTSRQPAQFITPPSRYAQQFITPPVTMRRR